GIDPTTDLAVIRMKNPPADLVAGNFGDSSQLKVGEAVMAIGSPLGLTDTVTTGIVSALDRPVAVKTAVPNDQSEQ
ncbi:trypsin-like peptidase domain-containing protein, partial [Streptococcus agalactiae]|nr:trypsin-like peptidase domain-containing protein [Streptococcus agalactiae]